LRDVTPEDLFPSLRQEGNPPDSKPVEEGVDALSEKRKKKDHAFTLFERGRRHRVQPRRASPRETAKKKKGTGRGGKANLVKIINKSGDPRVEEKKPSFLGGYSLKEGEQTRRKGGLVDGLTRSIQKWQGKERPIA